MAIVVDQIPVTSSAAALVAQVPPGAGTIILSNTGGNTVYVGTSNAVTKTNGFGIPNNAPAVMIPGSEGSTAGQLWAISTTGASSLGVIISTTH